MSKNKFLSSVAKGFGMTSAIFGWDMHDDLYTIKTNVTSSQSGYADFIALPDLSSFRRIPWEDDTAFFLLHFVSEGEPFHTDGCSMLASVSQRLASDGWQCLAGGKLSLLENATLVADQRLVELEFMNFQIPSKDGYASSSSWKDLDAYLATNAPSSLRQISSGMFGYSVSRPVANKGYFYDIFEWSEHFRCNIEGWHTERGPGVLKR